jgi:hypothetical protein
VKIFNALSGNTSTWKTRTIRGELNGKKIRIRRDHKEEFFNPENFLHGKKAALVSAINVFNEIFWDIPPVNSGGLKSLAEQSAGLLSFCGREGAILVVEPGIPRSGEFISSLRSSFYQQGLKLISPCVHQDVCPFPGGLDPKKNKAKWCHFSFETDDAARELLRLSTAAGLPKERAVLSFLLAKRDTHEDPIPGRNSKLRIMSDPFPVGAYYGRYGCSSLGAVLVRGNKEKIEALDSGTYIELKISDERDPKSGALIGELL